MNKKMNKMNGFFLSTVLLGIVVNLLVPAAVIADTSTVSFSASSYQVNENVGSTIINLTLQLPPDTYTIDDFESYASTTALQAAWAPDQYDKSGLISSYTLNADNTKYMEINANLGQSPYYDIMTRNLNGADWAGKTTLTIDYRGAYAKSSEKLEVEILDNANWANKWRSGDWEYPNDNTWHTKTIDISSCTFLNNVGPVRIVVKAKDYGTTRVGIDNIRVGNISPVTVSYATADGTASSGTGNDYYATSGVLQFNPGVTSQSFEVSIINDPFVESPETVILTLSDPVNATILGTNPVEMTINDNDPVPASARLEPELGCYVSIALDYDEDTIETFCGKTGYHPAAFMKYFGFPSVAEDWTDITTFLDEIAAYGGMAVVVVDPHNGLDQISQTDINAFASMCSSYNNLGVPIIVRFGHEMNASWYTLWSMKPDQYRTKFRAVADAIHSQAPLTAIAWTPFVAGGYPYGIYKNMTQAEYINGGYGTAADWTLLDTNGDGKLSDTIGEKDDPYSPFYPGDQYVDWVGLSCYHFGNAYPWGENEIPEPRKFAFQITGNYNGANGDDRWNPDFYAIYAEAKGKPMMIAETAAWYRPDDPGGASEEDIKSSWIEQVYNLSGNTDNASDIAEFFPRIKSIIWFNHIKQEEGYTCDWRISENLTVRANWLGRINTNKWGSGYFLGRLGVIKGKVTIQGRTNHSSTIVFELRNPGQTTPIKTYNITTDSQGNFNLINVSPGTYDLTAKRSNFLKAKQSNIVVQEDQVTPNINFNLLGGDCDNNNVVSLVDFAILRAAIGTRPGDAKRDARADFNGNNQIDLTDFAILRSNLGKSGAQ